MFIFAHQIRRSQMTSNKLTHSKYNVRTNQSMGNFDFFKKKSLMALNFFYFIKNRLVIFVIAKYFN